MTPDADQVLSLQTRLEELERRQRRLRWAGIAALALAGIAWSTARAGRGAATLSAEKFVLHDAHGNARAELAVKPQGGHDVASLELVDPSGKPSLSFAASDSGAGKLTFYGAKGRPEAQLVSDGAGPGLTLYDRAAKPRLWIGILAGAPSVELIDSNGSPRAKLAMKSDQPFLAITDAEGRPQALLPRGARPPLTRVRQEAAEAGESDAARRYPPGTLG